MTARSKKRLGVAAIAVALVAGGAWALLRKRAGGDDPEKKYRLTAVDRGPVTMTVTASGTVAAVTTVQVGSQVSGVIARLHADFNDRVRRGQLLAELDPAPFEAQVEQRRADLTRAQVEARNAELTYGRQVRLAEEGLAAAADLDAARAGTDAARAQVTQAAAALEQISANLRYTKIASPIDGVVVARAYDVGQTVAASFQAPTLFTIAQDLDRMQVQADVDQADIGNVHEGQTARFTVDAYPEQEFAGRVEQIRLNATVNQNVVSYPVIIAVANPGERLRPQMTANVTIDVAAVPSALRVPNAALRFRPETEPREGKRGEPGARGGAETRGGGAARKGGAGGKRSQSVWVLRPGSKLEPVEIRTGISDGRVSQVIEGALTEGDRVAIGLATSRAEATNSAPGMGGGRGMGGGGRRF